MACDFCGSESIKQIYKLKDYQFKIPGEFNLVKCNGCNLLYLYPQPNWEILKVHYPTNYDAYQLKPKSAFTIWNHFGLYRRCSIISKYKKGGMLLDVGCATGSFLTTMKNCGDWKLYGVEKSEYAVNLARKKDGINIYQGEIIDAKFPDNYFDVITWWDVLEHVPNPSASLYETYRILKPGGWVFIQTPDPDSWEAHIFGKYWRGFEAPRHLHLFPRPLLIKRLTDFGFNVKFVRSFAGNLSIIFTSLSYFLDSVGYDKLSKGIKSFTNSYFFYILGFPFSLLLRTANLSSSVLYVAQKSSTKYFL